MQQRRLDKETHGLLATFLSNRDLHFWTEPQRDAALRTLDRLPVLAKVNVVPADNKPLPLPEGDYPCKRVKTFINRYRV